MSKIDCLRCRMPGHCCKGFMIDRDFKVGVKLETVKRYLRSKGYPFKPYMHYLNEDATKENWSVSCPKLLPDGLCGIYEDRPDICRNFEAGSGTLCYHVLESVIKEGGAKKPLIPLLPRARKI